jgi:tetratricopeptide (TPR) repeat protein
MKCRRGVFLFLILAMFTVPSFQGFCATLDDANDLFRQRRLDDAIRLLGEIRYTLSPSDSKKACALLARCYWTKATYYAKDGDTRFDLYGRGLDVTYEALETLGEEASLYYWQAVLIGERANLRFGIESLRASETIKKLCEQAIELDPSFESGAAYVVLGRMYYKLPGLFGGSTKESVRYLLEAVRYVERKPQAQRDHTVYYFLAESYASLREYEKAVKALEAGLQCPKNPDAPHEDEADYAEMERLLEELGKKKGK